MARKKTSKGEMSTREIYPRLLRYTWQFKELFGFAVFGMAVYALTDTALVYMLKPLLDGSIVERDPFVIKWIPFFMLGLFIIRGGAGFVSSYSIAKLGIRVIFMIRSDIFQKFLQLPASFFDRNTTGRTTAMLTYHTRQVRGAATQAVRILVEDSLKIIGFTVLMFWVNWSLSLISLIVGPIIILILRHISGLFRGYSVAIQKAVSNIAHTSDEVLLGHRMVKIFGGETQEDNAFAKVNGKDQKNALKRAKTEAASVPAIQFVAAIAIAFVIAIAIRDTGGGVMSPGDIATFFGAMMGMMGPFKRLARVSNTIQTGMAAAGAIFDLLDVPGEEDNGTRTINRAEGRIHISNVDFRYPTGKQDVLRDINVNIEPGQVVAFVGRSGSGKTTLMSLIPRFYNIKRGEITLDGVSLPEYRLADLRRQISLVDQNVVLFNDTIANNIAYGALRDATREQIREAAHKANAADFIESLPKGYDTKVGQNGLNLSGGQRQRLAIARAVLKDAPILLLDEATSALDTESEKAIQEGLDNLMRDRTTLVIAHRLSTIHDADQIVVMHDGAIMEHGTHTELMARDGHYKSLHDIQFAAPKEYATDDMQPVPVQ